MRACLKHTLPIAAQGAGQTGCGGWDANAWPLLPGCPLMSSVLSQGACSQPCAPSTASGRTQQDTFSCTTKTAGNGDGLS